MNIKKITYDYYQAWVDNDREKVRSLLDSQLKFRSPKDSFDNAEDFVEYCWKYAEGFDIFNVKHEVYDENSCYVVYGSIDFCCGDLLKIRDGKIYEIYVTFNPIR